MEDNQNLVIEGGKLMYQNSGGTMKLNACSQNSNEIERYLNPSDINLSEGYTIEVFAYGLDSPISLLFTEAGDMIIAESGLISGKPRVLRLVNNQFEVIAENILYAPITGINYLNNGIVSTFVINKSGYPASLTKEGGFERPADVVFGPDGAMYVLDLGMNIRNQPDVFVPNTGVIWKITKK